jgi:hypothetical protein
VFKKYLGGQNPYTITLGGKPSRYPTWRIKIPLVIHLYFQILCIILTIPFVLIPSASTSPSLSLDMDKATVSRRNNIDMTTLSEYLLKCYDEKETCKFKDFLEGTTEECESEDGDEETGERETPNR